MVLATSAFAPPGVRGLADPRRERWGTVANGVTAARTALAVGLGLWAAFTAAGWLVVAGYAVYWLGDVADGWLARRRDEETRIGAVADIVCDRLCTAALAVGLVLVLPWTLWPVVVFGLQFVGVDLLLSLGFLRWPLLSPNYFYLVDRSLYRWNWSPPAKALNTASVVAVTALSGSAQLGAAVALLGLVVKTASLVRLGGLARADAGPRRR